MNLLSEGLHWTLLLIPIATAALIISLGALCAANGVWALLLTMPCAIYVPATVLILFTRKKGTQTRNLRVIVVWALSSTLASLLSIAALVLAIVVSLSLVSSSPRQDPNCHLVVYCLMVASGGLFSIPSFFGLLVRQLSLHPTTILRLTRSRFRRHTIPLKARCQLPHRKSFNRYGNGKILILKRRSDGSLAPLELTSSSLSSSM